MVMGMVMVMVMVTLLGICIGRKGEGFQIQRAEGLEHIREDGRVVPWIRAGVRVRDGVRVRVRLRFAFCSFGFSFTEYIHTASFSMWCERES